MSKIPNNILAQKVEVFRLKEVKDGFGGSTKRWERLEWLIKCRIYMVNGAYTLTIEGKEYFITHRFVCGRNEDITEGDKILVQNSGEHFIVIRKRLVYDKSNVHHISCLLAKASE